MKKVCTFTLIAFFSLLAAQNAQASLNLRFTSTGSNQITFNYDDAQDVYMFQTTGTDPYIHTRTLRRSLNADEYILSFEYQASADIADLQLFFSPISEQRSHHFRNVLKKSNGKSWNTISLDINQYRQSFNWGAKGDNIRFDWGNVSGITINVRHIHIHKPSNDPWVEDSNSNDFSIKTVLGLGLPVVSIETVNHEEPTCDYVGPPPGSMGGGITNATKVPGQLWILSANGDTLLNSGPYAKDASGMTLKIRGNTSAYPAKKPFKIKLQKKADLLLRGNDKKYKDKEWILLKDENLLAKIGFRINDLMGQEWTPAYKYVNVFINNDYRGVYMLVEAVKRNTDCRLNVAKDGYVIEQDPYWWNGEFYINSMYTPSYNYTFKYPDEEDFTPESTQYIQNFMTNYENSIAVGSYPKFIDVNSFASWLLGHDIFGTYDSGGSNMYFTKYDSTDSTKLFMANMWDFDSSEQNWNAWSNLHIHRFPQFFTTPNHTFVRQYVRRWDQVSPTIFSTIINELTAFKASAEAQALQKSIELDNERWDVNHSSINTYIDNSINWFTQRKPWLTQAISELTSDTTVTEYQKDTFAKVGKTIYLQAEEYDEGGLGVAYMDHHKGEAIRYRYDSEQASLRSGSAFKNNWAIGDMGVDWNAEASGPLTTAQAIDKWGCWYQYTFTAEEDMEATINLRAGVHWGSYGAISVSGSGNCTITDDPQVKNWVKTYTASCILSLDGVALETNQKSHPVNTNQQADLYKNVLQDKDLWTRNAKDTVLWLYPNKENLSTWDPYYQKDVYGEPDNYTVNIKKGQHTIRVTSLASQWLFDELAITGVKATNGVVEVSTSPARVWTQGQAIRIDNVGQGTTVQVFNMSGQLVYNGNQHSIAVTPGAYVVRIHNNAYKVWVK